MSQVLVLIDSNVFITHLRAGRDPVQKLAETVDLDHIVTCGVVKAEVLRGVKPLRLRTRLEEFFSVVQNITTPNSMWEEVWMMAWKLDRKGRVLPLQDVIIACCALRAGAAVMTAGAHFQEVPGLTVIAPS